MKAIYIIFICNILFLSTSCVSPINCRKQFTCYREPINSLKNYSNFYSGIFVSMNGGGALCFFDNGLAKYISSSVSANNSFWINPEVEIKNLLENDQYFKKELWGHFQIIDDTIIIQNFGISNDQLCRRSVYEKKGVIVNDSTIIILSNYSFWFDNDLIKEPDTYRLFKTDQKPDSTLAWFRKKRWYHKNIDESRR